MSVKTDLQSGARSRQLVKNPLTRRADAASRRIGIRERVARPEAGQLLHQRGKSLFRDAGHEFLNARIRLRRSDLLRGRRAGVREESNEQHGRKPAHLWRMLASTKAPMRNPQDVERVMRTLGRAITGMDLPAVEKVSESQSEDP